MTYSFSILFREVGDRDYGVSPYFRDEFVRDQLVKKKTLAGSGGEVPELNEQQVRGIKVRVVDDNQCDQEVDVIVDKVDEFTQIEIAVNKVTTESFVAGETINVSDNLLCQLEKPLVLVQPSDLIYSEAGNHASEMSDLSSMAVNISDKNKKVKLSENLVPESYEVQSSSPELYHKIPATSRQEGNMSDEDSVEFREDGVGVHTNMFGVKYVMWFDISIEGKSSMDREEDDWGGKLEFGFSDTSFPKEIEDYFLLFEDNCSIQSHNCFARVKSVVFNMRNSLLDPPSYDPRSIEDLLNKYSDAHVIDSGWREVDTEEWVA